MRRWLLSALLGGGVAAAAYRRRALTLDGAVGAALVGCIVFARGGLPAAGALLAFFSSSTTLSRAGQRRKQGSSPAQAKGAQRDVWQVLANGGFATLSIMLGRRQGGGAFLGALSAAGADTWATELGMLAHRQPRMITTLRKVEPGTSGGVTPEGLAASLAGALAVGLAWSSLDRRWQAAPLAAVAGVCGSLIDSILGATIQALYRCPACDALTEQPRHRQCGRPADLVRGKAWVTNDTVNALSTLTGAAVGAAWWRADCGALGLTREPGVPTCLAKRGDR
ncbi:MAG: DUF92 domain-containing protein [Chloroflexota bacterium]|nr:DUF92 domain-containing protein [Chloroflexota bacterium]